MPAKSGLGQNGRAIAVVKTANLICYVGVTPEGRYRRILSGERDGEQRMRRDGRMKRRPRGIAWTPLQMRERCS